MIKRNWQKKLVVFFLIILGIIVFLASTKPGLQVSFMIAKKIVPGTLEIEKLQGKLFGEFHLKQLSYSDKTQSILIGELNLEWRPLRLLTGRLVINTLHAKDINIHVLKESEQGLPTPPSHIVIKNASLSNITYQSPSLDNPININEILLRMRDSYNQSNITRLNITTQQYKMNLRGHIGWHAPYSINLRLTAKGKTKKEHNFASITRLSGSMENLSIDSQISLPFKGKLTGKINLLGKKPTIDIEGNWKKLQWPFVGKPIYFSKKGQLKITGPIDKYRITLKSNLSGKELPNITLDMQGQGTKEKINLEKILIHSPQGKITGQSIYQWKPQPFWKATLNLEKINPGLYIKDVTGSLNGKITLTGGDEEGWQIHTINLEELNGTLHNAPVIGKGALAIQKNQFNFSDVLLKIGDNKIMLNGGLNSRWDLSWNIAINKLKQILPTAHGSIISQGGIKGLPPQTKITAKTEINNFSYEDYKITHFTLNAKGTALKHHIVAKLIELEEQFDLTMQAKYTPTKWQGKLTKFNYTSKKRGTWQLKSPSFLTITQAKIMLEPICILSKEQKICLEGEKSDEHNWKSLLSLTHVNTDSLQFLLPESLRLSSQLDMNARYSSHNGRPKGLIDIELSPGKFHYILNEKHKTLSFHGANIKAEANKEGFYGSVELNVSQEKQLKAEFNLPHYRGTSIPKSSQVIQGHAQLTLNDFAWLDAISPELSNIKGLFDLTFNVEGTLEKPKLHGRINLKDASTSITTLGTTYENISLEAKAMGTNNIRVVAQVQSGDGKINVTGQLGFDNMNLNSRLHIVGENFLAINTPEYKIHISPDINIEATSKQISISGKVLIPKATITPKDFSGALVLPKEVTFLDRDDTDPLKEIALISDIQLELGDNIQLHYLGLSGRVTGKLQIKDAPNQVTTGNGQLTILNGKYIAYGKELKIERGDLFYTGNHISNPGINLTASRMVTAADTPSSGSLTPFLNFNMFTPSNLNNNLQVATQIKVGIHVTGTLEEPKLSLFSQPANMPQSEILSYLILGRPIGHTINVLTNSGQQAEDSEILFNALSVLNLGGNTTSQISSQLEHTLGLDKIELTTTSTPDPEKNTTLHNTALVLGKALSPRLYIDYTFGLLATLNIFRISYKLTDNWVLQSQTSETTNSFDMLYTVERK